MGIVYVWEDDFSTEEEYQNAYKRAWSVMKIMGGEKQYEGIEHSIDPRTDTLLRQKYRITYELSKLSILNPTGNIGFLSGSAYITVKEIYNLSEDKKITDKYDAPKRLIEDFRDELYNKLYNYFRIIVDFEMIYENIN